MLTRALPLGAVVLFLLICLVWRSWLQYRRYGTTGIVLSRTKKRGEIIRDLLFMGLFAALILQTIVFLLVPQWLAGLAIPFLSTLPSYLGLGVFAMGFALMVAAQLGMGSSWRIGIDETAAPGLVTGGLYRLCRNPIYLGLFVMLFGLTLLLATWVSLALTIGLILLTRFQTLQEEQYLRRTYGAAYSQYAARVGRFVPGLGRLEQTASDETAT